MAEEEEEQQQQIDPIEQNHKEAIRLGCSTSVLVHRVFNGTPAPDARYEALPFSAQFEITLDPWRDSVFYRRLDKLNEWKGSRRAKFVDVHIEFIQLSVEEYTRRIVLILDAIQDTSIEWFQVRRTRHENYATINLSQIVTIIQKFTEGPGYLSKCIIEWGGEDSPGVTTLTKDDFVAKYFPALSTRTQALTEFTVPDRLDQYPDGQIIVDFYLILILACRSLMSVVIPYPELDERACRYIYDILEQRRTTKSVWLNPSSFRSPGRFKRLMQAVAKAVRLRSIYFVDEQKERAALDEDQLTQLTETLRRHVSITNVEFLGVPALRRLQSICTTNHSQLRLLLIALLSPASVPRLGVSSPLSILPILHVVRYLAPMLSYYYQTPVLIRAPTAVVQEPLPLPFVHENPIEEDEAIDAAEQQPFNPNGWNED